jgi:hypothetical protein
VTVLLTLITAALWLRGVQALLLLASEFSVYERLQLKLPPPAEQLAPLSRWLSLYWWAVVLGIGVLTPVLGLVTYWIRHRLRFGLGSWLWGFLMIVPPLLGLEVTLQSSYAFGQSAAQQLRKQGERSLEYLAADGQQLRWSLKIREVRRGAARPVEEVLVIDPSGDWHVTVVGADEAQPPFRQGKLEKSQLLVLVNHLVTQNLLEFALPNVGLPPVILGDSLCIEFGPHVAQLPGACRRTWWLGIPAEPWEEDMRSRFRSVVLVVDDLVKARGAP